MSFPSTLTASISRLAVLRHHSSRPKVPTPSIYYFITNRFQHTSASSNPPLESSSSSSSPSSASSSSTRIERLNHHKLVFPEPSQTKPDPIAYKNSFHHLQPHPLHPTVLTGLTSTGKHKPTYIQRLSIQKILSPSKSHVIIASETGSGKTLAYLIPLISRIKSNEPVNSDKYDDILIGSKLMSPSVLILQPTRELTHQAYEIAKELSYIIKLRVRSITSSGSKKNKRAKWESKIDQNPMDVLIGTPGSVNRLITQKKLFLSNLRHIVIDEADELLESNLLTYRRKRRQLLEKYESHDQRFDVQIGSILKQLKSLNHHVQHIYVVATISSILERSIKQWHEGEIDDETNQIIPCDMIKGERLHMVGNNRQQIKNTFIRIDAHDEGTDEAKYKKLIEIVSTAVTRADCGKVMIFCDGHDRRDYVTDRLNKLSSISSFGGAVHLGSQNHYSDDDVHGDSSNNRENNWKAFKQGTVKIGVCSKSFGRGIDDTLIKTVVLMDVPLTGAEYLHRVGRIRNGGRVYVIVGRREQVRAESIFYNCVKGRKIAGTDSKSAWKERTESAVDRIETDEVIRKVRKESMARWVDERISKLGTFRGKGGRGIEKVERRAHNIDVVPQKEKHRGVVGGKMKWPDKPKKKRY